MIYFICIIHLHIFHGNIWTHNWPAPNVSGFIAQLVERRTGIREVTGSSPVEVLNFFQASLRNCKNCDHNCEDHSSFDFISAVHIWFISYASFKSNNVVHKQQCCVMGCGPGGQPYCNAYFQFFFLPGSNWHSFTWLITTISMVKLSNTVSSN